jgi:hypothetical protein
MQSMRFLNRALLEYREGRSTNAIEWLWRVQEPSGTELISQAQRFFILAMARYQLKQPDLARAAMSEGLDILQTKLPTVESGNLGPNWNEILIANILSHEAKNLIEGASVSSKHQ